MAAQEILAGEADGSYAAIDIKEALPLFQKAWNKTKEALFEMLELIQKYQDRPGFDAFCGELESRGVIKRSVMSMLTKIASNPLLMKEEYRPRLPSSYNTLWVLTSVEEKTLAKKLQSNEIRQDTTVEEARALKAAATASKTAKQASKTLPIIATIRLSNNATKKHKANLTKLLNSIEALGAIISRSSTLE